MIALSTQKPLAASHLARWTLAGFVLTFLAARILVLLIMTRRIPDLFMHVGHTHVHHLNYGIFLLVAVGGWLLFAPPAGRGLTVASLLYGVGLALTFDEFGMWLHLGGGYWQRASYDAVAAVASMLGLLVVGPEFRHFRARQWALVAAIVVALGLFAVLTIEHLQKDPSYFNRIEQQAPR